MKEPRYMAHDEINFGKDKIMYFEKYKDTDGWRWRLNGDNNEVVASGQAYADDESCLHAIRLLQGTNADTPIKEFQTDPRG